ncbi:MAG: peptide-methionine (R)-S-oxide reductase MsrB [Acidobacteriota bacterium]
MTRRALVVAAGLATVAAVLNRARGAGASEPEESFEVTKTDAEWKSTLTPAQYAVLRKHGTEPGGSSPLNKEHRAGTFLCAACALPVYSSKTKYESGTGWPSFWAPIDGGVGTTIDRSLVETRVEVHCHRCGGHLGHVFDDGPRPTGKRYCMNGVAMTFSPST